MSEKLVKRSAVAVCLIGLSLVCNAKVYAANAGAEQIFLTQRYGIDLYKHHIDQNGLCVMVNDSVVSESQMEELLNLNAAAQQQKIIQQSNFLVRRTYRMKHIRDGEITAVMSQNTTSDSGNSYIVTIEYANNTSPVVMSASIYSIADEIWEEEPGQETAPPDAKKNFNNFNIIDYAFVLFSTATVIAIAGYGRCIYLDIKTLIWYKKKRIARREKKKCQQ